MANLTPAICKQLAKARREKGMTQSALAEAVGCKQSAISMLEAGQAAKVGQETVEKIASLLDVALESAAGGVATPMPRPTAAHAFCPNALCFSNVPYALNGELIFWPRPQPAGSAGKHCAVCGELLEHRCPHCGETLSEGACCTVCGKPKVTNTLSAETDAEAWSEARRRTIAEWRTLQA